MKALILFGFGVITALLIAGGILIARTYFVSADPSYTPQNITIERLSPTAGEVTFTTESPIIASIECSKDSKTEFSLCGAESTETTSHQIKTSIILDPGSAYYFIIKIRNTSYDQLGAPFVIPIYERESKTKTFPNDAIGSCQGDAPYNAEFDINKDGCIRSNDKVLFDNQ